MHTVHRYVRISCISSSRPFLRCLQDSPVNRYTAFPVHTILLQFILFFVDRKSLLLKFSAELAWQVTADAASEDCLLFQGDPHARATAISNSLSRIAGPSHWLRSTIEHWCWSHRWDNSLLVVVRIHLRWLWSGTRARRARVEEIEVV